MDIVGLSIASSEAWLYTTSAESAVGRQARLREATGPWAYQSAEGAIANMGCHPIP